MNELKGEKRPHQRRQEVQRCSLGKKQIMASGKGAVVVVKDESQTNRSPQRGNESS